MFEMLPMSVYTSIVTLLLAAAAMVKPYPPLDSYTGLDSYVEKTSIELVTNSNQWLSVWNRHRGITPIGNANNLKFPSADVPPNVDFDQNEVLVLFGGLASEGGYKVVDSEKTSKAIVVRVRPLSLPGNGSNPSSFKANPYAFVMFKKTKLPFQIQVPGQPDQSGTVQWRTVATVGGN